MGEESWLTADVVDAVRRHMNDDHAADNVLICRAFGDRDDVEVATMTGCDETGIDFDADGTLVRIPWSRPVTERAQIRVEVVRLYEAARERLHLGPDGRQH